jgi:GNAT superfamily N-acetyltransferase
MAIEYRKAVETDARQLAALRWEFKNSEERQELPDGVSLSYFLNTCEAFLRQGIVNENWIHWIAEAAGQVIGMASLQMIEEIPEPEHQRNRYGCVTSVYTKPAWRRQGVGTRLMTLARESALQQGIGHITLWTTPAARGLYARCGFIADVEAMFWERE